MSDQHQGPETPETLDARLHRGELAVSLDTARVFLIDATREAPEIAMHMGAAIAELHRAAAAATIELGPVGDLAVAAAQWGELGEHGDAAAEAARRAARGLPRTSPRGYQLTEAQRRRLVCCTIDTARGFLADVTREHPAIGPHVSAAVLELNRASFKLGALPPLVCIHCRIDRGQSAASAATTAGDEGDQIVGYPGGHMAQRFVCPLCAMTWEILA